MDDFEMDRATWQRVNRLLDEALDLPASERRRWLDGLEGDEEELKPRLEALLRNAEGTSGSLGTLPKLETARLEDTVVGDDSASSADPGAIVGPYRLKRLLGKGGMGAVWLAERADGLLHRSVALKLPRGYGSHPELESRMAREREILASLNHRNIGRLYDAGLTDEGQPYLALELIEGVPVDVYARERELDLTARLELFLEFARAVAYAHSQLVVHRDIKPSNILVTQEGEVRLLDFGIAKLIEGGQTQASEITELAGRPLTLAYAAPEQVLGEPIGVGVDVYSLGVVLYELLTGSRPCAPERDTRRAMEDAILHVEPAPPSEVAVDEAVAREMRGDVDTILLKSLRKKPEERYPTVNAFVDDVERFLSGRPVLAQPDTTLYRAKKFVQRHRAAVLAAGLGLALLVGFTATSLVQARRIAAERDRASAEERNARQMVELVVGMFETTDPTVRPGGETLEVEDFLDEAREKVEALDEQPELQARMKHVLGRIFLARSRYQEARGLLEDADALYRAGSERDEIFALDLDIDLARALEQTSDLSGSAERLRAILPRLEQVRGADHPLVTQTRVRLGRLIGGEEGEALAQQALAAERRRQPSNPMELARALAGVAEHRNRAGDRASAERLYREASEIFVREFGEDHPHAQTTLGNLALVLEDDDERVAIYRRLIDTGQRVGGPSTGPVGTWLNNLGVALRSQGRLDEAEEALLEAVAVWSDVGGDDHWRTALSRRNLASVYLLQSRNEEAMALTDQALESVRQTPGAEPRIVGAILTQRAFLLSRAGRPDDAVAGAREAVAVLEGPAGRAPALASAQFTLGQVLLEAGRAAEAEAPLRAALAQQETALEPDDPQLGATRCALGRALASLGQVSEAEPLLGQGLETYAGWVLADARDVRACEEARRDDSR